MREDQPTREKSEPLVPLWGWVGGGALLLLTALAAPFYAHAVGGIMWAADAVRALCGW